MDLSTTKAPMRVEGGQYSDHPPVVEFSIGGFFSTLLRGWWIIGLCTAAGIGVAVYLLRTATPVYTASMTVMQPQSDTRAAVGNLLQQRFGIGSGVEPTPASNFKMYMALMSTPELVSVLQDRHQIMQRLFPGLWDEKAQAWIAPTDWLSRFRIAVREFVGVPGWAPPDLVSTGRFLGTALSMQVDQDTGTRTILFDHSDPEFALELLRMISKELDTIVRERSRKQSERRVDYLSKKLQTENVMANREVLIGLLTEEGKNLMLSNIDENFAVNVVSQPSVSRMPTSPKVRVYLGVGLLLGALAGGLLTFAVIRPRRRPAPPATDGAADTGPL